MPANGTSEGGESGSSSSRTAAEAGMEKEEIEGVIDGKSSNNNTSGGVLSEKDEVNDENQINSEQEKEGASNKSNSIKGNLSTLAQIAKPHDSSTTTSTTAKDDDHSQHKSESSNMSRTINTIPVWARNQVKESHKSSSVRSKRDVKQQQFSSSSSSSPKSKNAELTSTSQMKKPAPLLLNETNQTRTAIATQEANTNSHYRDYDIEADQRSIATSSYTTYDEDEDDDHGPSRFASLTYRPIGVPTRRPGIPFRQTTGTTKSNQSSDKPETSTAFDQPPHSAGLSSLVSGLLSGSQSIEGQQSKDTTTSSDSKQQRQQQNQRSYESNDEKNMSGMHEGTRGGWSHDETHDKIHQVNEAASKRKLLADDSFTRNQPLTPGWESPWRPESRGEHSIRFGKYRFNNHGEGGYFPRTETGATTSSRKRRRKISGAQQGSVLKNPRLLLDMDLWRKFLLHNAFVPLLFRSINIAFTTSTLAIAIKLFMVLHQEGAQDSVGMSPIIAIVFAPLTLIHVCIQIYLEYFSRPIGLWRVGSKLFYTMTELIFVCLWSAELSLAFDNYFTSTLVCSPFASPYNRKDNNPVFGEQGLNDPSKKPYICRLQGALIGLVFTSLLAYVVVFSVSLFRIFVRVSKR